MTGSNTLTFTDSSFDSDVLKSSVPVLVDFWAEWCPPCRQMTPAVDALATQYDGKVKIGKLNIDDNGQTTIRYNVRSIPSFLLFKNGQVVDQRVGAMGRGDIQKMLDAHVAQTTASS